MEIVNKDFIRYKKIQPIASIINQRAKKPINVDIINSKEISEEERKDYTYGKNYESKSGVLIPDMKKYKKDIQDRFIMSLFGASGSGKSYLAYKIAKQFLKRNPSYRVVLISTQTNDHKFDKLNPIKINCIDPEMIKTNFTGDDRIRFTDDKGVSEFKNCLIIIDDIEVMNIPDKQKNDVLKNIYNDIIMPVLFVGRHQNCSLIFCKHDSNAVSPMTRQILQESEYIALFLRSGALHKAKYIGKNYFGWDKHQIALLDKNKGRDRYIIQHNRFPYYMLFEHELILL